VNRIHRFSGPSLISPDRARCTLALALSAAAAPSRIASSVISGGSEV